MFLTADAFGVLPPISRLTRDQAAYHFISGYTAKLAGTEIGVKEPKATFSTCFGAPFMPRHPGEYAAMLVERLEQWDVPVWLVNTGWTGGPYGIGERMNIDHTRSMVRAALTGALDDVPTRTDPIFGVEVPASVPDVPTTSSTRARPGPTPTRYDRGRADARARCSPRTSRAYADGARRSGASPGPRRPRSAARTSSRPSPATAEDLNRRVRRAHHPP